MGGEAIDLEWGKNINNEMDTKMTDVTGGLLPLYRTCLPTTETIIIRFSHTIN